MSHEPPPSNPLRPAPSGAMDDEVESLDEEPRRAGRSSQHSSSSDWILVVEDGALKGLTIAVDHDSGDVLSLSTRSCRDADRWVGEMPPLTPSERYVTLQTLDLHRSRYLVRLPEALGDLSHLRQLHLERCDALEGLPSSLGRLLRLQEVCSYGHPRSSVQNGSFTPASLVVPTHSHAPLTD